MHRAVLAILLRMFGGPAPGDPLPTTNQAKEMRERAARVSATVVPWPGRSMATPAVIRRVANPTGPESQVNSRRPQSEKTAWPTASEAAQRTATDAYAPSKGADRIRAG